eukprot:scaffold1001_cov169-Amphora_coffeaeformis.AAC.33
MENEKQRQQRRPTALRHHISVATTTARRRISSHSVDKISQQATYPKYQQFSQLKNHLFLGLLVLASTTPFSSAFVERKLFRSEQSTFDWNSLSVQPHSLGRVVRPKFSSHQQQQQQESRNTRCALKMTSQKDVEDESNTQSPTMTSSPTDRFHADMQRVLESRRHRMQAQNTTTTAMTTTTTNKVVLDRSQRPAILESDVDGAERVHGLLRVLCQRGLATEKSFQIVMQSYVRRGRLRWRPNQAVVEMPEEYDDSTTTTTARTTDDDNDNVATTANKLASSLSSRKLICAADQVEALFHELVQRTSRTTTATTLSVDTYNLVLEAYANCATPRGGYGEQNHKYAQRAQALLKRLQAMRGTVPVKSILHVLHATAWQQANLQPGVYAQQAHEYLEQIRQQTKDPSILSQAYSLTLEAYSKSGSAGSAATAETLLMKMIQINATQTSLGTRLGILDAEDFSNAVLAWSKANEPEAAQRAQTWLEKMVALFQSGSFPDGSDPPLIAFNGVIVAWSRQGDYNRAAAVLSLLDDVSRVCRNLIPDVVSYNSVLHAYFRSKAPLVKARKLVKFMHQHCDSQPSIRPNSFTYYTYLKCLLQSRPRSDEEEGDLMAEREDTLNQLETSWLQGDYEMEPTNRIFNMVINAYAKSSDKRAWRKAMHLLDRMKNMAAHSKELAAVRPDIITITSIMDCLSKALDPQAPQLAKSLLQDAFDRYHETLDIQDRPNLRAYTMAILTLAKNHGSVVEARQLLDNLVELYKETGDPSLRPNAYPYNYVLNCAASTVSDDPAQTFQIATRTFQDLRQARLADSYSYAFWIKCCIHLVTSEELKKNCVRYAFDECKRDGLVTAEVLFRLSQALPRHVVMEEMLEGKVSASGGGAATHANVSVNDLPKAWTRKSQKQWKVR